LELRLSASRSSLPPCCAALQAGYSSASLKLQGAISVNSEPITANQMQRISGFVHQEDVIMDTMTVREALTFSAMMRLPSSMPEGGHLRLPAPRPLLPWRRPLAWRQPAGSAHGRRVAGQQRPLSEPNGR
jgi:hypothetical protein